MSKSIFVHIPKNGGTSIIGSMGDHIIGSQASTTVPMNFTLEELKDITFCELHPGYMHMRWMDFKKQLTENHPAVAVVRNPWSRVVSRYKYAVQTNRKRLPKRSADYTFEQFLDERLTWGRTPRLWVRPVRSWYQQLEYVTDEKRALRCSILRFEHLDEDVSKYFNIETELPKYNASNEKKDYREYYNSTTKEIIADWYKEDIDFFGFTFDGTATKNIWETNNVCLY